MAGRDSRFDLQIKFALIGDSGVGKTCLLLRYANDSFSPTFITSIGADFKIKNIQLDGKRLKLQIWDLMGQERFRTITTSYFRGSHGFFMVYDVTDRNSFISIRNWVAQIQMHGEPWAPKILVGNKCDVKDQRAVTYEEGESLGKEYNIHFFEASAKSDINVEQAFVTFSTDLKNYMMTEEFQKTQKTDDFRQHFQSTAVALRVSGAASWYNKHKINGRYTPLSLNVSCYANNSTQCIQCYQNIDSVGTFMYFFKNTWLIKKNNKLLARVPTSSYKCMPNVAGERGGWVENYGVYFERIFPQPALKCVTLEVRNDAAVQKDCFDTQDKDHRGSINMDLFKEYSKEPENLGLTVPLFVKYCLIKIANLDLEFQTLKSAGSADLTGMQAVSAQKLEIERTCRMLLKSVSMPDTDRVEATAPSIIQAAEALVAELEVYFEQLLDVNTGNFEVAKRCRDTKLQLTALITKLKTPITVGQDTIVDAPAAPSEEPRTTTASDGTDRNADVAAALASDLHSVQVAVGGSSNDSSAKIVQDSQKQWTCRVDRVGWVAVHSRENRTTTDITWKCTITTGLSATKSTKIGAALTAGMSTICSQLQLDMEWSSCAAKQTEHEHNLTIPPNTRLVVEQEVIEGVIVLERKVGLFVSDKSAKKEEKFKVAKDSLRMQSVRLD